MVDGSRYSYLCVKEELIKEGTGINKFDQDIFCWFEKNNLIDRPTDMSCGRHGMRRHQRGFTGNVITKLKKIFKFRLEDSEAFTYVGIEFHQKHY
mgnify:CR=1 FL=1